MDVEDDVVLSPPSHEEKAVEQGWKPQEEWVAEGKNPEDWVDARTFNQRGEYMDRIKTQSSLIKKLEKKLATHEMTLKELADHHRRVAEIEYDKALKDLKGLKKDALDLGDHEKVIDIDDKIQAIKEDKIKAPVVESTPALHPDVVQWMEDNPWYEKDAIMRGAAEGLVADMINRDPSLKGEVKEVLERVTKTLKEEFPHKFGKKPRMTVTETGTSEGTPQSKPKYTARHLNAQQAAAAKRFVEQGAFKSVQGYVDDLAKMGFLDAQSGIGA